MPCSADRPQRVPIDVRAVPLQVRDAQRLGGRELTQRFSRRLAQRAASSTNTAVDAFAGELTVRAPSGSGAREIVLRSVGDPDGGARPDEELLGHGLRAQALPPRAGRLVMDITPVPNVFESTSFIATWSEAPRTGASRGRRRWDRAAVVARRRAHAEQRPHQRDAPGDRDVPARLPLQRGDHPEVAPQQRRVPPSHRRQRRRDHVLRRLVDVVGERRVRVRPVRRELLGHVLLPSRIASEVAICAPIACPSSSSKYGNVQPSGDSVTPSSDTNSPGDLPRVDPSVPGRVRLIEIRTRGAGPRSPSSARTRPRSRRSTARSRHPCPATC